MWLWPLKMQTSWCWSFGRCWRQIVRDFEAEIWSRSGTWIFVKILKVMFCQDFEANFSSRVWILVKILKLKFCRNFETEFRWRFWSRVWSSWSFVKILMLNFDFKFWCFLKAVSLVKENNTRIRWALAMIILFIHPLKIAWLPLKGSLFQSTGSDLWVRNFQQEKLPEEKRRYYVHSLAFVDLSHWRTIALDTPFVILSSA